MDYESFDVGNSWCLAGFMGGDIFATFDTTSASAGAREDILAAGEQQTDLSGNPILQDVGVWMKGNLKKNFPEADVKYIDPSYLIRSIPTISADRIYCKILAHNAVHGAFAGYTGITVGLVNTHYVYLPIPVVISAPRRVDPKGKQWNRLRASIGQPSFVPPNHPSCIDSRKPQATSAPAVPPGAA